MRKIRKGMKFVESGKQRNPFIITMISNRSGFAHTNRGTKIKISRLSVTKYYRILD